jgi:hypothetical protein
MAGLGPAIPLIGRIIGIAGPSPALTAVGSSDHAAGVPASPAKPVSLCAPYCVICSEAGLPLSKIRISM